MPRVYKKCVCGHFDYDHYSKKYDFGCIHRMGRYTGVKCTCPGFTMDNLVYLEGMYEQSLG